MAENTSSSVFQKEIEGNIIKSLKLYCEANNQKLDLSTNQYLILNYEGSQLKVQPDICDLENLIFGEIYTCGEKLLPGQQRKIGTDMLKLLSIEKVVKPIQNKDVTKIIILTSSDSSEKSRLEEDTDLTITKKLLGPTSWKVNAIKLFDFKVMIYFLGKEIKEKLDDTRKRQGEKFKNK